MIAVATELELMYVFSFCVLLLMFWGVNIYISFAKSKMKNDVLSTRYKTMNYLKHNDYQYGYDEETEEYNPEISGDYITTRERKAKLYKLMYEEFQKRKILNTSTNNDEKNYVEVLDVDTGKIVRYIIDEE